MRGIALYLYVVGAGLAYYTTEVPGSAEAWRFGRALTWPAFPLYLAIYTLASQHNNTGDIDKKDAPK